MQFPQQNSEELFVRVNDQRFEDLDSLYTFCLDNQDDSEEHRLLPADAFPIFHDHRLKLKITGNRAFDFNHWSFEQACSIAKLKKANLNRLDAESAVRCLMAKLPYGSKPIQILTRGETVRAINRTGYSRLFDADLLGVVIDEADWFDSPPRGFADAWGLYAGEQDMFAFLTDRKTWVEVGDEAFSPGFFVWNSEVG